METSFDWKQMRPLSKSLFRKDHRLAVAVVAHSAAPQRLYAQAIAEELGLDQGEVAEHFRDFEDAGLLTRTKQRAPVSAKGGRPGQLYARTDDEFWHCLEQLGERFRRPTTRPSSGPG
jgi:predicted ArsR family transcriptional regulator